MVHHFFDEQREQSRVKAEIVRKYFDAWAAIITATQRRYGRGNRIGYVDLFAGPGRYKNGAESTPLQVLNLAVEKYSDRLVTIFNDGDPENASSLKTMITEIPGIEKLKHKPKIWNSDVGDSIASQFAQINTIPILAFVDPWGYKGLSLKLVNAFIKDWGCDIIFFSTIRESTLA